MPTHQKDRNAADAAESRHAHGILYALALPLEQREILVRFHKSVVLDVVDGRDVDAIDPDATAVYPLVARRHGQQELLDAHELAEDNVDEQPGLGIVCEDGTLGVCSMPRVVRPQNERGQGGRGGSGGGARGPVGDFAVRVVDELIEVHRNGRASRVPREGQVRNGRIQVRGGEIAFLRT